MSRPTFLVVGAARSGTTALAEGLRTHPGVFMTLPKEPHYFALHGTTPRFAGPGDDTTINRIAVTDRDAYLALYPDRSKHAALGEASVSTMYYHREAIPEIQRLAPDVRVVALLRDPVERAHSAFDYMTTRGFEPEGDLLAAVADEPRRIEQNWHHLWHYTAMSRYADAVQALMDALGRDRVKVCFYDDLQSDYVGTVRDVLRFIGTDPAQNEGVGVPVVNSSGSARSKVLQASVHAATRNETLRSTVKGLTSFRMREAVRRRLLRRNDVSASSREQLLPLFVDDLRRLDGLVRSERPPAWLRADA